MKPWTKQAQSFYKTKAWQNVRNYVMQRDAFLCQDCYRQGVITPAEEVHHIIPITDQTCTDPAVTLNPDNCISLCRHHHQQRHSDRPAKRYTVDAAGHVKILE